jgi:hypothetical protein
MSGEPETSAFKFQQIAFIEHKAGNPEDVEITPCKSKAGTEHNTCRELNLERL